MPGTPLVSVVLPVYNGRRFVAEAVGSILRQTYRQFELVIVDDGSTDGSPDILAALARSDSRIIVRRHHRNRGCAEARNLGVAVARGELIASMDQDDLSHPERLAVQVAFLQANPDIDAVGTAVQRIDADGRPGRIKSYPAIPGLIAWSMFFFNGMADPSVMLRRAAGKRAGWFDPAEETAEDYGFYMRACRTMRLANLRRPLLQYRVWAQNLTGASWEQQERTATQIVRRALVDWLGEAVSSEDAAAIRGLATERYPRSVAQIEGLARLVNRLRTRFLLDPRLTTRDRVAVNTDAAVKLWLLSALAAQESISTAAALARTAGRISPTSVLRFALKAARRGGVRALGAAGAIADRRASA